jgi:RNA polymerase sigma factor (sigma-70 family)
MGCSSIVVLIAQVLWNNEYMSKEDILKEIKKNNKDILCSDIEKNINNDLFKHTDNDMYTISDRKNVKILLGHRMIKKRIAINNKMIVSNNEIKFHKESDEKFLDIEKHMAFIKNIAYRAAKLFNLDVNEIFSEAIALAYEHKDKYDPKKGNPTTFLNSQITTRLYNKIKREILPNYFHVVTDEFGNKKGKRFLVSQQSLDCPIKSNNSDRDDIFLIDSITKEQVDNDFGYENNGISADTNIINEKIRNCLKESNLSDNEILVIEKRFGLDGEGGKTLDIVGEEINLTKERVRQILKGISQKLKNKKILREIYGMVD